MSQGWGLLDRVLDTGCPLMTDIGLDLGAFQLVGSISPETASTAS
jgi:hypothetical protein